MSVLPDWYNSHVNVAVMLSPAAYTTETYVETIYTEDHWNCMAENNLYVFNGPEWASHDRDYLKNMCDFSETDLGRLDALPNNPTQVIAHYAQNISANNFQAYDEDWWTSSSRSPDSYDLGPLDDMKVAMLAGLWDNTVPMDVTV